MSRVQCPPVGRCATNVSAAPVAFGDLWDASDVDPIPGYPADPVSPVKRWVRVGFKVNPGYNPPPQFVPAHTLPAVAEVPACVSPLHADAPDYVPASATSPTAVLATLRSPRQAVRAMVRQR